MVDRPVRIRHSERGKGPVFLRGRQLEGLGHREVVDYVKSLGITSIELLPIHAFPDDDLLLKKGLRNYWGYNTMGFFAPASRYYGPKGLAGFRDMVRAFHDANIEVILDVVYNHTAEGNEMGPTLSFKGIDNFSYYRTMPGDARYYINDTGTGNTVNTSHPRVLQLVTDSLRYWAEHTHIDGFRFDLGTILGREPGSRQHRVWPSGPNFVRQVAVRPCEAASPGHAPQWQHRVLRPSACVGSISQGLRIGMAWRRKDAVRRAGLEAQIHRHHPVRDVLNDRGIMRNEQHRQVPLVAEPRQEIDDSGLHRNVECRNRLVANEQRWVRCQCAGNAEAPPLPVGIRIKPDPVWLKDRS